MCSKWYCPQFNKIEKAWVWVEILCLNFQKTWSNQYIKLRKVTTFKNCEIFFTYISHLYRTIKPPSWAAIKAWEFHDHSFFCYHMTVYTFSLYPWLFPYLNFFGEYFRFVFFCFYHFSVWWFGSQIKKKMFKPIKAWHELDMFWNSDS